MNNQEILITILVIVLFIFKFNKFVEGFDTNYFPCVSNPTNSNCTCPNDSSSQRVLNNFSMNYGQTSPYLYTCVSNTIPEPNTNVYQNSSE